MQRKNYILLFEIFAKYIYSLKLTTATTDTCGIVVIKYGITLANFIAWNPSVGPTCTGFVGGTAYCVRGSKFKRYLAYFESITKKFLTFRQAGPLILLLQLLLPRLLYLSQLHLEMVAVVAQPGCLVMEQLSVTAVRRADFVELPQRIARQAVSFCSVLAMPIRVLSRQMELAVELARKPVPEAPLATAVLRGVTVERRLTIAKLDVSLPSANARQATSPSTGSAVPTARLVLEAHSAVPIANPGLEFVLQQTSHRTESVVLMERHALVPAMAIAVPLPDFAEQVSISVLKVARKLPQVLVPPLVFPLSTESVAQTVLYALVVLLMERAAQQMDFVAKVPDSLVSKVAWIKIFLVIEVIVQRN
ncbi:Peptidoglycan-binding lysin domain protein [Rutstroemia sp. NJR-2017a BVV2]|nr:Peptidoglycan-binding lysin domain protein [Rutstroemia sp. NJR-2017a BVV2]